MAKIELGDFVKFGRLFEIYGKLLSDDRQKIMTDYFVFNMTLVEIAEQRNISRQAVLDAVRKSCEKLTYYENLLGFLKIREKVFQKLDRLQESYPNLKSKVDDIKGEF